MDWACNPVDETKVKYNPKNKMMKYGWNLRITE
jgi:hypothetical protein